MRILALALGVLAVGTSLPQSPYIATEPTALFFWGIGLLALSRLFRVRHAQSGLVRTATATGSRRNLDLVNQSLVRQAQV